MRAMCLFGSIGKDGSTLGAHVVFLRLENIGEQGGDLVQVDAQRSRLNHALICTMNMHNEHE
jgi:hypothetical protein